MFKKNIVSKLVLVATMLPLSSHATEVQCLAKVLYSEAKGESILGVLAIGAASKNRSLKSHIPICALKGVTSEVIPADLRPHFEALARSTLSSKKSIVLGADSWNTGTKPHLKGDITRQIGRHVFYVMAGL